MTTQPTTTGSQPQVIAKQYNRIGAALFAILLGGLGIHKFYLGKPMQGVFYVVFCWTFIPAIIGLVEGIMYLMLTDEAFAVKYG